MGKTLNSFAVFTAGFLLAGVASAQAPDTAAPAAATSVTNASNAFVTPVVTTEYHGALPLATARISNEFVEPAKKHQSYETGDLHILYSDKGEVVLSRLPGDAAGDPGQLGFRKVKVADDGRTIGWVETFKYSDMVPGAAAFGVGFYSSGSTVFHVDGELGPGMVWFWEFMEGGKQAVVVWGPGHGGFPDDYELYDTRTGKLLAEAETEDRSGTFASDTPAWAIQAQSDCGRCAER